ncbi:PrsW family glutamic-type intramembrane protease [Streptococcus cuniculipharyngis]|uniref:PrsW family intramembrane metalloprotease n=1 Tax=Streptococcus cuniculipharyngis TaxID=1562651 RepID=A0A5C5SC39_9STRE|nr:PrsW family glutamic-type intramembrane protease [Streptococcus cuniculipharyngis]TWS98657.1 PrsW family intramembrane metalloprotease [Streptococcus cuniculipharyngis]
MNQLQLTRKQWSLIGLLLLATCYGIDYEIETLTGGNPSLSLYPYVILASLLISIYLVPFIIYLRKAQQNWQIPSFVLPLTFFVSLFASSWTAVEGNDLLASFWAIFLDKKFLADWEMALTAPLIEELVKTGIAICLLAIFGKWDKKWAFLLGITTGMGFQVIEDIEYIYLGGLEKLSNTIPSALYRIAGSLSSHYLYTALLTVGVALLISQSKQVSKSKIWLWILAPVICHFFWNSPLNVGPVSAIISSLSLLIFLDMVLYVMAD